jgi:ribosome maturation factor RimP
MSGTVEQRLSGILQPPIEELGYEFVGLEMSSGPGGILRIYIDGEDGITVDDCAYVSRQVGAVLDVEDPIAGNYTLEVSSPGVDRPMFTLEDYARFAGSRIRVQMSIPRPVDGRRRFGGRLVGVRGTDIVLEEDDEEHVLAFAEVAKAQLIGEL